MSAAGNLPPDDPIPQPLGEGDGTFRIDPATLGKQALALQAENPRFTDSFEHVPAMTRLRDSLPRFALDPSGSDPHYYSSPRDLEFYAKLKEVADTHQVRGKPEPWPGAIILTHKETTFHWFKRKDKGDPTLRDHDGNPIYGYRVGYLNVAQYEAPVLFCSDGKLRMLIKPVGHDERAKHGGAGHNQHDPYAKRTFSGYCSLPDPELLYPVLDAGTLYPVSYKRGQSNNLQSEINRDSGFDIPY